MKVRLAPLACIALSIGLAGCPNGPGSGGPPLTFDQFVADLGHADCNYFQHCDGGSSLLSLLLHSTVTDCETQFQDYFDEVAFAQYRAAMANGTLVFHGDLAAACLSAFDAAPCSPSGSAFYSACLGIFEGHVPDGGACTIGPQCASGGQCTGASGTTCGTCSPAARIGEPCSAMVSCTTGALCASGICRAPGGLGAACDPSIASACQTGLTCVMGSADPTHGTCTQVPPPTLGMPCTTTTPCASGLVCGTTGTSATLACRAPRTDGTCQTSFYGPSDCPAGTVCTFTSGSSSSGTCTTTPTLGQACMSICAAPARCVSGMCVATRHQGETCTQADECLSGFCTSGVCTLAALCTP